MTIVLDENKWASEMLSRGEFGGDKFETLRRVARYFIDLNKYSRQEIREMLDKFLLRCDPTASLVKWSDTLDNAVKTAYKRAAVDCKYIPITVKEWGVLKSIKGVQLQRLAFTLLCLAKYWDIVNNVSSHWVNSKNNEIMKMANINTSTKRQTLLYNQLYENGMISLSCKMANTNVRVEFIEDGEEHIKITDFRNLGNQFKMLIGDTRYIKCQECGIVVPRNAKPSIYHLGYYGRPQIYCNSCAAALKLRNNVNNVMKHKITSNDEDKKYTVYEHLFPDGKRYIGITSQELKRCWANGYTYKDMGISEAIDKAGWDNIRHFVLFEGLSKQVALAIQSKVIQNKHTYSPRWGYNKSHGSKYVVPESINVECIACEVDGNGNKIAQ